MWEQQDRKKRTSIASTRNEKGLKSVISEMWGVSVKIL